MAKPKRFFKTEHIGTAFQLQGAGSLASLAAIHQGAADFYRELEKTGKVTSSYDNNHVTLETDDASLAKKHGFDRRTKSQMQELE